MPQEDIHAISHLVLLHADTVLRSFLVLDLLAGDYPALPLWAVCCKCHCEDVKP